MDIYEHVLESKNFVFDLFHHKKICFLDIETTGLSRKFNQIYLIGLVYFNEEKNKWNLKQLFAKNIEQEKILLEKFNSFIDNFNLLITYNGDSFDIPFIKYRFKEHNIDSNIYNIDSFDIYRKIKAESPYLNFNNFKLKTIEEALGIYREDEYSGKDCINFYYQYMNKKDDILKEKILKHNYDDLYYLIDILKIFELIDNIKTLSINFNGSNMKIKIENISIEGDLLKILCEPSVLDKRRNIIYYQDGINIHWQSQSIAISLEIGKGLITPTKKALYFNKTNFPSDMDIELEDLSEYMVPDNILLLKVENKYVMENIKNIIKNLLSSIK